MVKKYLRMIFIVSVWSGSSSFGDGLPSKLTSHSPTPEQAPNCIIVILMEKTTGDIEKLEFPVHVKSKKECRKRAGWHAPNWSQSTVRKQKVSFKWLK